MAVADGGVEEKERKGRNDVLGEKAKGGRGGISAFRDRWITPPGGAALSAPGSCTHHA